MENYIINNINFDYNNLIIERERISNEFSYINPIHVIKSVLEFLIIKPNDNYFSEVIFYDIVDNLIVRSPYGIEYIKSKIYPFRIHRLFISIEDDRYIVRMNSCNNYFDYNQLIDLFDLIKLKAKISYIYIYKNTALKQVRRLFSQDKDSSILYRILYKSEVNNLSIKNKEILDSSVNKIIKSWKSYTKRKNKYYKKYHKTQYSNVLNEIIYLPKGGYVNKIHSFKGGKEYIKAKKRYYDI